MILSYQDPFAQAGRRKIHAKITTDHPASKHGMPVIVLDDGQVVDMANRFMMLYQVEEATQEEQEQLRQLGVL